MLLSAGSTLLQPALVRGAPRVSESCWRAVPGSSPGSRCVEASTAASFATKPRGWSRSRGRAWRRGGEHACPSVAEPGRARRGGPGSNPTPGTIDPRIAAGQLPATPVCSGGRASEAAPSHGHPRPGPIPAPSPTRPGSPGGPGCRCPSETPSCHGRAPACPHLLGDPSTAPSLGPRMGAGAEQVAPGRAPKFARSRTDPPTGLALVSQERRPAARVPPRRTERAPEPLSTRAPCLRGHSPAHSGSLASDSRSTQPPGSAAGFSRFGSVPEPCRKTLPSPGSGTEQHRRFPAPRTRTGLCRRWARTRDPSAPPAPPAHGPAREGGASRTPGRSLFVSEQLGDNWGDSERLRPAARAPFSAAGAAAG